MRIHSLSGKPLSTFSSKFVSIGLVLAFVAGCFQESSSDVQIHLPDYENQPLPESISDHVEMEPVAYTLSGVQYTSGRTRIFYSFHRADSDWESKPLFVFFNGGPGSSTAILMAWNTGPTTLDEHFTDGAPTGKNPHSWTTMGNLLYIDARQTGFSYGLVSDPEDPDRRQDEFTVKNHNFIFDAAEFIRVVLRFARTYSSIRQNEIFLVGESYGGTRATAMLNLLLHYRAWGSGDRYYTDPALTEEIQAHLDECFPELAGSDYSPATIATQFRRQIMIQPFTVGARQRNAGAVALEEPGSPLYDIAEDTGTPFVPCVDQPGECNPIDNIYDFIDASGRDVYYMSKPRGWLLEYFFGGSVVLAREDVLEAVTGVSLESMEWMYADARKEAFRGEDYEVPGDDSFSYMPPLERRFARQTRHIAARVNGDLAGTYGELNEWDQFYISYASEVGEGFYTSRPNPYDANTLGRLMIENMGYVETFITNASLDFRCFTPAVPAALSEFTNQIDRVEFHEDSFTLHFRAGLFGEHGRTKATVAFPTYPEAGHTVSYCAPESFLNDVRAWIEN